MSLRAVLSTVALTLVLAAPATAAIRYVSPSGGASSGTCASASPGCTYTYVLNGAGSVAGDTVIIAPGTYDVTAAPIVVARQLAIQGTAGGARPLIKTTTDGGTAFTLDTASTGSSLTHVAIQTTGNNGVPLNVKAADTLTDLDVTGALVNCVLLSASGISLTNSALTQAVAGGSSACLQTSSSNTTLSGLTVSAPGGTAYGVFLQGTGTTLQDSTVVSGSTGVNINGAGPVVRRVTSRGGLYGIGGIGGTITDSIGIGGNGGAGIAAFGPNVVVRNVVGYATGATSYGIKANAGFAGIPGGTINVRNAIARGETKDVFVDDGTGFCPLFPCSSGSMTIDHSNFRTKAGPITDNGAEQSGDPVFVNPATYDFHLGAGSPAIDAGVADASNGTTDRDGNARSQGAAPDLGAYETTPVVVTPPADTGGGGGGTPTGGGTGCTPTCPGSGGTTADTTKPVLSRVAVQHHSFRVAKAPTALVARKRKPKPIPRGTSIRWKASEAGIVKITVARARKIDRILGTIQRTVAAGYGKVRFTGRLGTKALKPGYDRLVIWETDAAGNVSTPIIRSIRILPAVQKKS
jgi:hypothetical protein